jgi:hypothetical protein
MNIKTGRHGFVASELALFNLVKSDSVERAAEFRLAFTENENGAGAPQTPRPKPPPHRQHAL